MEAVKGIYHPDKLDAESFIANFTIRLKEFAAIIDNLNKQKKKPLQHFLITGKRGMGKSTLLRRIYLEVKKKPLSDKILAVRLGTEQYKISKLYKLWEEVIKILSLDDNSLNEKKEKLSVDKNYEEHIIHIIVDYLQQQNKTLLLLIDNFDQFIDKLTPKEQHAFREILIQYQIQIIGNTVFYNEHFFKYEKAFFDFFKPIHLRNLDKDEAEEFIKQLAANEEIENFDEILKTQKGKIETLRILSGGVPRTLVILLSILSKRNTGDAIDYLNEMLEQVTPLYQDRMKALSSQQQEIMHHLAIHWDRTSAKDLSVETRIPSKSISAQLVQLEDSGYINKISTSKRNHLYEIDERFFNIWLLMSESSAYDAKRVIWLTKWLDMFYESSELEDYASYCNGSLKHAKPASRFLIIQALSQSEKLSWTYRDKLVEETKQELSSAIPEIKEWANIYTKEKDYRINLLDEEIALAFKNKNYSQALLKLEQYKNIDESIGNFGFGLVYEHLRNYEQAEQYYLIAIEKGNINAMINLGFLYEDIKKDYDKAEQYYLMAVEKGNEKAMFNLGFLYDDIKKDYDKAEQYYLMAVEKGNEKAMFNLGFLYENVMKDYDKAEQYYLMAVEKGDEKAMVNLGLLYDEIKKDYDKAEQYYLRAVEKGNADGMVNLGFLYKNVKKDYDKAEQYYLMAIEKDEEQAMINLGVLYKNVKKDYDKAEQYYLMAVEKGNKKAMVNLGFLYEDIKKDYDKAEQYYLMAIEKGDEKAMVNLGSLYDEIKKDYDKAEQYYLMAVEKGSADALFNLGFLYEDIKKDYDKAEQYYLMAIEKGNEDAVNNLSILYYEQNDVIKKENALSLTEKFSKRSDPLSISTRIVILLWNEKITQGLSLIKEFLEAHLQNTEAFPAISSALVNLLIFKQKQSLYRLFSKEFKSLKDKFKPVYFALLHEMKDELPDEYLKMTEEISEPVNDLLKLIQEKRQRLGIK